ncbi:MAG TPA: hypothetical protein VK941_07330 [Gillisia sp.]|nr:hypothetical protein [Gillisia sp.]
MIIRNSGVFNSSENKKKSATAPIYAVNELNSETNAPFPDIIIYAEGASRTYIKRSPGN